MGDNASNSEGQQLPGGFHVDEPFDEDSLSNLRARAAMVTTQLGMSDRSSQTLLLILSELATNAVIHGGGSGWARLWVEDGTICCQVRDNGPGIVDPTVGTVLPPPQQATGRGLWIVRTLAAHLVISPGASGRGAVVTASVSRTKTP